MFDDFPRYQYLSIALRFAIDKEHFKEFEYTYITDIDIMIMREHQDIEYFHCAEMNQTGLCYSNSLRNANHYAGSESLSGLHFATREWFERTNDMAGWYRERMAEGLLGLYREWDGLMLYRIADKTGCGLPKKYRLTNRHHGIHCAGLRLFNANRFKLESRISSSAVKQWNAHRSNRAFNDIMNTCCSNDNNMRSEIEVVDRFCTGRLV